MDKKQQRVVPVIVSVSCVCMIDCINDSFAGEAMGHLFP